MVDPEDVAAVIPTRGDVELAEILESIRDAGIRSICVWDNSTSQDLAVYGRYAPLATLDRKIVYTQDDDCIIDVAAVLAAYEPGRLVANMPVSRWRDYPDSALVGWGSVFDCELPALAFQKWFTDRRSIVTGFEAGGAGELFRRTCDVVFSALTPRTIIDIGFRHLPWAEDPARAMFKQPGHKEERDLTLALARTVRTWVDDDRRYA